MTTTRDIAAHSRTALAGMFTSFVLIGALQAMYGPAIPAVVSRFGLSAGAAGWALSAHFVGALIGVLATPALRRRMPDRVFLGGSLVVMAVGLAAFAAAPAWLLAVAAAFLAGTGWGGIDVGVNEVFTESYSHGMLNVLHALFGVGAIFGPLLVGALGAGYVWGFVLVGALSAALLLAFRGIAGGPQPAQRGGATRVASVWRMIALFMVFYVLHVGVESGVGGWETGHLVHLGWSVAAAATATSTFWLSMTLTRFAVAPLARWLSAQQIVLGGTALMLVGSIGAHWAALAPVAYVLVGVGVAPLFPTGLVWLKQVLPHVPNIIPYVIALSMLGGLAPTALGTTADVFSLDAIPTALTVLSAVCLLAAVVIAMRRPRHPDH